VHYDKEKNTIYNSNKKVEEKYHPVPKVVS
jgi:hypothetical protein